MKPFFSKYHHALLLVFVALAWLFLLNLLFQMSRQTFVYPDSYSYLKAASQFYNGFVPNERRPLLFSAINGLPLLFGYGEQALFGWNVLVNIASWLGAILLLFGMLRKTVSERSALFFSLAYVFSAGSTFINFYFLSEPVFTFFLLWSLYLFQRYFMYGAYGFLAGAISVLVLSLLVKPASTLLILALLACFFPVLLKNWRSKAQLLLAGSLLCVALQLVVMKKQYGNYTISYIDAVTYYNYLGARAEDLSNGRDFQEMGTRRRIRFGELTLPEQKEAAFSDMKKQLQDNKWNLLKAYGLNLFSNAASGSSPVAECDNISGAVYVDRAKLALRGISKMQNIAFTLIGLALSLYYITRGKHSDKTLTLASCYIFYIFLLSGISCNQGDRFHIVFYPMVLLLLAKYWEQNGRRFFTRFSGPLQR